jgi:nucleoside 2-deoxyribosyltransferase
VKKMLIYLAGPLFCEAESAFNLKIAALLEERGYSVFLPQRDGIQTAAPTYRDMQIDELQAAIFALDRDKVFEADVLLFVLDGRVPDEGACVELGLAYAQKHLLKRSKLLIGLMTDRRSAFPLARLTAMVQGALDKIVEDEGALIEAIEFYQETLGAN